MWPCLSRDCVSIREINWTHCNNNNIRYNVSIPWYAQLVVMIHNTSWHTVSICMLSRMIRVDVGNWLSIINHWLAGQLSLVRSIRHLVIWCHERPRNRSNIITRCRSSIRLQRWCLGAWKIIHSLTWLFNSLFGSLFRWSRWPFVISRSLCVTTASATTTSCKSANVMLQLLAN